MQTPEKSTLSCFRNLRTDRVERRLEVCFKGLNEDQSSFWSMSITNKSSEKSIAKIRGNLNDIDRSSLMCCIIQYNLTDSWSNPPPRFQRRHKICFNFIDSETNHSKNTRKSTENIHNMKPVPGRTNCYSHWSETWFQTFIKYSDNAKLSNPHRQIRSLLNIFSYLFWFLCTHHRNQTQNRKKSFRDLIVIFASSSSFSSRRQR